MDTVNDWEICSVQRQCTERAKSLAVSLAECLPRNPGCLLVQLGNTMCLLGLVLEGQMGLDS